MKKIYFLLIVLSLETRAKVVIHGNLSGSQSGAKDASYVKVGDSKESKEVECNRDDGISYGFLTNVLLGKTPDYTVSGNDIIISLPQRVSACLGKIEAETITNQQTNNVHLKFKAKIKSGPYSNKGLSPEQEYELCMKDLALSENGKYEYNDLLEKGHIAPPETMTIGFDNVNPKRNSKLIISSTQKDLEYRRDNPFDIYKGEKNTIFTDPNFNCMDSLKPKESDVMLVKTSTYREVEESIAICEKGDLASIYEKLKSLRLQSSGNYHQLSSLLSSVQNKLINERATEIIAKLEEIEDLIAPSVEDVKNGDEFGVGKKKRKELLKKYAETMNYFSKELLPILKDELIYLQGRLEELGDSGREQKEKDRIEEEIEGILDIVAMFDRQKEGGSKYKRLVKALREGNMQRSGKKILTGLILAQEYSEANSKKSLERASNQSDKRISRIERSVLADWGDEALIRAGDKSPIQRRKEIIAGINKRAHQDKKRFSAKMSHYDEYIQDYTRELVNSYCSSGGNYQDCMTVRSKYLPKIYSEYSNWRNSATSNYYKEFNKKFTSAQNEQREILNRFNGLYSNYKLNELQSKVSNDYNSNFDLWTGADPTENNYSPFGFGFPSLNTGNERDLFSDFFLY
ncbi:hypothetical protein [Halobacteriovorax sp. CON-3]|uniref:hypothetical protein n=1 Tax=Halobacteriovorax sp. CON-3 TaxID=3157710 RepID=UPI00371E5FCB